MKFEWDERKNQINIGKHDFDFADVARIFDLPLLSAMDARDYGEERWISIGMLDGRVIVVVYTELAENTILIISLRTIVRTLFRSSAETHDFSLA
ncbi:MAG: BrnT family toxin [Leptolyngbya sp. SIOISBB]|nr:BrnT family toxin [Leptolyngbya sp. SIOISBB]